jgi:hypothetical protein
LNPESLPCSSINVPSFENDVHILRHCTGGGTRGAQKSNNGHEALKPRTALPTNQPTS